MKQVINGKVFNTETANVIGKYHNGLGSSDFRNIEEFLYKTKKGAYFIAGSGGAMTRYAESYGNMSSEGEGIREVDEKEALAWMEEYGEPDDIERHFGDIIEEA